MNNLNLKILIILVCAILLLSGTAFARQDEPMNILDVYAGLPQIIGDTITVKGYYHSPEYPVIGLNAEMFEISLQPSPHSLVNLVGTLPDSSFSYVEVEGVVDTVARHIPLFGVTYLGQLTILSSRVTKTENNQLLKRQDRFESLKKNINFKADECTFAILICSDNKLPAIWMNMVNFWMFVNYILEINLENIYAFYHDGNSKLESVIPSDKLRPATHDIIKEAFNELEMRIAQCEAEGKSAKLIKMVTDHGSGYHTGSSNPTGPQQQSHGWGGGHIDTDGDETDFIPETELKFDLRDGPAVGKIFQYDLNGDGKYDFKIENMEYEGHIAMAWNESQGAWFYAGRDADGDSIIDSQDGGIDINGDGDTEDSFAWDEDLALSNDRRNILDDEWAAWQKKLSEACLDEIFELINCCFSGGFQKDEADNIPCKTAVQKAMSAEEGEYSKAYRDGSGSVFVIPFVIALSKGKSWEEAYEIASNYPGVNKHQFGGRKKGLAVVLLIDMTKISEIHLIMIGLTMLKKVMICVKWSGITTVI